MTIPFLKVIQNIGRRQPPYMMGRHHLILAGISQALFLKNWGEPEAQIHFKRLGSFYRRGTLYLIVNSDDEADYSVWIYRKKDRVFFFTRKKLIAHFKWSGFREKHNMLKREIDAPVMKIPAPLIAKTLALVA